jgi:hypothetical protein
LVTILSSNKCYEDKIVMYEGTNGNELEVAYLLITVYLQMTNFHLKIKGTIQTLFGLLASKITPLLLYFSDHKTHQDLIKQI